MEDLIKKYYRNLQSKKINFNLKKYSRKNIFFFKVYSNIKWEEV